MTESLASGAAAVPLSMRAAASLTTAAVRAARQLLIDLERSRRIDAAALRRAMEAAFGASDAAGVWNWKTACDVCGAATVLFLCKFGPAIRAKAGSTAAMLPMLARIGSYLPTHTRRSEDSQAFQQFSKPIPLGLAACTTAGITPSDRVLVPSAGTGLLTIFAELAGGALMLNELAGVYRRQTNGGERIIGRKVSAAWVANVVAADAPLLTPDAVFAALMERRTVLELAGGLQLRCVRVMGAYRIELLGFNHTMRERLRACGILGEIISWKLRMFVPTDASGIEVMSKVLGSYPVARIGEQGAA
jgi:hypothetical protein